MSIDLEAIEARAKAATRGPWYEEGWFTENEDGDYVEIEPADAAFTAHAREDIPALLAEVKRLNAENEAMQSIARHAEELDEQLAAVTAERDAAVNDLRGKCQYCVRQPMRRLSDGQLDALCATCQEYNKCNWKYRGAGKEEK